MILRVLICLNYPFLVSFFVQITLRFVSVDVDVDVIVCFKVAVAHTIGHVAATVSMSKVAVSFTHIIKSGEPAFSVLVSRFLLGETFPLPVYLSLLPIIGGCALAAVTELNFNMTGNYIQPPIIKSRVVMCNFRNSDV